MATEATLGERATWLIWRLVLESVWDTVLERLLDMGVFWGCFCRDGIGYDMIFGGDSRRRLKD